MTSRGSPADGVADPLRGGEDVAPAGRHRAEHRRLGAVPGLPGEGRGQRVGGGGFRGARDEGSRVVPRSGSRCRSRRPGTRARAGSRRAGRGWWSRRGSRPGQRAGQLPGRVGPGGPVRDHLGQHRVVVRADHRAVAEAGVDPDARAGGKAKRCKVPVVGRNPAADVLGVEPDLDRVAADPHLGGAEAAAARLRRSAAAARRGRGR